VIGITRCHIAGNNSFQVILEFCIEFFNLWFYR
jgi:hypothetical protein